ncbi:HNH endonuclease signature motif containing protein [Gordonia sp. NB41Y]|uniref:HNH endonuclease signature motif containing protein n=1 Tax=Gordonia sp. NB41Y TaxID=875808 RepID=UPI0002BDC41C|nr:HNH endonuclease signature motif containing protein [Gordonia sp. NB41Y]WLP92133.1 DUF222 domain-containing protein [Gordonia sp. NB41Y]
MFTSSADVEVLFDGTPPEDLSRTELGDRLVGYASQITAMTAQFLAYLAEFDKRRAWADAVGVTSCVHWLSWRTGISRRTAHEYLRVARALAELPLVTEAFGQGRLSYSKVRAITRVATPIRERELVNIAMASTAKQVEDLVRATRTIDRRRSGERSEFTQSTGSWKWHDDGSLSVSMHLTAGDAAQFLAGVTRAEYERTRVDGDPDLPLDLEDPETAAAYEQVAETVTEPTNRYERIQRDKQLWRNVPSEIAPAVLVMAGIAQSSIEVPELAPTAEVIVHMGDDHLTPTLAKGDGTDTGLVDPHLEHGPALSEAEAAELACSAAVREVTHDRNGAVLNFGRKRRRPTLTQIKAIVQRDHTCQTPGCERTGHLHIHHVVAWALGGRTDLDNLILLCSEHHRALHRGEFGIEALGMQQFVFRAPDGTEMSATPPPTAAPPGWRPNPRISADAVSPRGGGRRLDLVHATDVIYANWALRAARQRAVEQEEQRTVAA